MQAMDHVRIGQAMRRMREQRNLSQRDLEKAIGQHNVTIGMRERGKLRWDEDDIDAYLAAIKATRKDLEHALAELPVSRKISATIPLIPSLASAGRYWIDRGDAHEYPMERDRYPAAFTQPTHKPSPYRWKASQWNRFSKPAT